MADDPGTAGVDPLAVLPEAHDPSDPYARTDETFPRLSDEQVARVASFGRLQDLPAGTVLFEIDDRGVDFFLVLAGFEGLDGMAVAREEALEAQRVRRPAAADQRDGGVAVGDEAGSAQDERPHHHIRDVLR